MGGGRYGSGGTALMSGRDPQLRRARAARIVELKINNVSNEDVALMMGGLNEKTVRREIQWAEQHGIVEEVRKQFTEKLLSKAAKVYERTLDMDATEENVALIKVHDLKLKAARDVAQGTGALRKQDAPKAPRGDSIPNLEGYIEIYKARMALKPAAPVAEIINAEPPAPITDTTATEDPTHEPIHHLQEHAPLAADDSAPE